MNGQPAELVLHQYLASPYCAKIRRILFFKGLPYNTVNYGIMEAKKAMTLSGVGKLPCLVHGDTKIEDSTNIAAYLEELSNDVPLYPADPKQRAMAHVLEDWADESLYFYDVTMRSWANNVGLLQDDLLHKDPAWFQKLIRPFIGKMLTKNMATQGVGRKSREQIMADTDKHFAAIDALLVEKYWLVGDNLSIADIAVASMCTVMARAEEGAQLMSNYSNLMSWRKRVDRFTIPEGTAEQDVALA